MNPHDPEEQPVGYAEPAASDRSNNHRRWLSLWFGARSRRTRQKGQRLPAVFCFIASSVALVSGPVVAQEKRFPGQGRSGRVHAFVSAGGLHTLFVNEGSVWAWGDNGAGQLGNGLSGTMQFTPVTVSKATGMVEVVAVAAGGGHSVALDARGHVWAWGDNSRGQLGDGTVTPRALPVQLAGVTGFSGRVTAIAAGAFHTLALTNDGQVWTWGDNFYGQLGDGSTLGRAAPSPITSVVDAKQVSAGGFHSLALDVRGRIWAFGRGQRGQIGDGFTIDRPNAVELFSADPTRRFIEVAAGAEHSLAIDEQGNVMSWGADSGGQLGNGPALVGDQPTPMAVNKTGGLDRAVRIAAGGQHSLALNARGRVYGWGQNVEGAVGDGSSLPGIAIEEPVLVAGISGRPGGTAIATGDAHSMAVQSDGRLVAWGSNLAGQVGNGSPVPVGAPVDVVGMVLQGKVMLGGAWQQGYVVRGDGSLWAWGDNTEGQLGDGTDVSRSLSGRVDGIDNVIGLSANTSNILVLRSDGTLWGWGKNQHGQMGFPLGAGVQCPPSIANNVCVPIQIGAGILTDVKAVAAGTYFHLALQADGSVWSWGNNTDGQLGRGLGPDDPTPGLVPGVLGAISLAGGGGHSLALMSGGSILAWGRNTVCELGVANCCAHNGGGVTRCNNRQAEPPVTVPTSVAGQNGIGSLQRITAINATLYHASFALDINGRVLAWGDNVDGQLGDGNSGPFWVGSFPGLVKDPAGPSGLLDDVDAIGGGGFHCVARKSDGTVRAWGRDTTGQLGDGFPVGTEPMPVAPACQTAVVSLAAGAGVNNTLIRRADASLCASGDNSFGQLGDGTTTGTNVFACDTAEIGYSLRMDTVASGRIYWDSDPAAQSYRVYRGSILGGSSFTYTHACLTPAGVFACPNTAAPCPPEYIDTTLPTPAGGLLYYLVATRRGACGEDHLGRASWYTARPKGAAFCP